LTVADVDRIDEFINYYQNNGYHTNKTLDDEVKFALMEVILVSIDDAKNPPALYEKSPNVTYCLLRSVMLYSKGKGGEIYVKLHDRRNGEVVQCFGADGTIL